MEEVAVRRGGSGSWGTPRTLFNTPRTLINNLDLHLVSTWPPPGLHMASTWPPELHLAFGHKSTRPR